LFFDYIVKIRKSVELASLLPIIFEKSEIFFIENQ
jgi:hypothetical protein